MSRAPGPPLKFKAIRKRVCEELGTDYPEYARGVWGGGVVVVMS